MADTPTKVHPKTGFVIHVTHDDDFLMVQPIVQKHLREMMGDLMDQGVYLPAIDCGPYLLSSTGEFNEET